MMTLINCVIFSFFIKVKRLSGLSKSFWELKNILYKFRIALSSNLEILLFSILLCNDFHKIWISIFFINQTKLNFFFNKNNELL